MLVDAEVNRRKYELELQRLTDQRAMLEARGVFVLSKSSFPLVEVHFAPRWPLLVGWPIGAPTVAGGPTQLASHEIPCVAARPFNARFDLSGYDLYPPSLDFFDPWTDQCLGFEAMAGGFDFEPARGLHQVLLSGHPLTNRPFLCLRGTREYHEHPQHTGDDWMLYRGDITLFSLVMALWRVVVDLPRPLLLLNSQSPMQFRFQLQWVGREAKL